VQFEQVAAAGEGDRVGARCVVAREPAGDGAAVEDRQSGADNPAPPAPATPPLPLTAPPPLPASPLMVLALLFALLPVTMAP
jgi:hypothetical protein